MNNHPFILVTPARCVQILEDKSCLFSIESYKTEQSLDKIKDIIESNVEKKTERIVKEVIKAEWEDTT